MERAIKTATECARKAHRYVNDRRVAPESRLSRILKLADRVMRLTALPADVQEAALSDIWEAYGLIVDHQGDAFNESNLYFYSNIEEYVTEDGFNEHHLARENVIVQDDFDGVDDLNWVAGGLFD